MDVLELGPDAQDAPRRAQHASKTAQDAHNGILYYDVLLCTMTYYSVLRRTTLYYDVLLCTMTYYSVLRRTTLYYDVLLCTTTYYFALGIELKRPGIGYGRFWYSA